MALPHHETAARVQEEHERLKAEMARIFALIDQDVPRHEFSKWKMDLLFVLRDFHNDLLKHFDLEEEGGFMNDIVRTAPQHIHAVELLAADHKQMATILDGILTDLKAMTEKDYLEYNHIRSRIEDFFASLKAHEAKEADIMLTTYFQDTGGGD